MGRIINMILIGIIVVVLIFVGAMVYSIREDAGSSDKPSDKTPS